MYTFLILGLYLFYFWYFYVSLSKPVPKPSGGAPNPAPRYHTRFMFVDPHYFEFRVNSQTKWRGEIPESFEYHRQRLVSRDACHGRPDDYRVPAQGIELYRYLEEHPDLQPPHFKEGASSIVRNGPVFYFTCRDQRVHRLDLCPSGQVFVGNACEDVQPCTGLEDGTLLAHPEGDATRYIRCQGGQATTETCPPDTFFLHNACHTQKDISFYCQFFNEPFLLDGARVDCVQGQAVYTTCPEGHKFFKLDGECEPTTCEGYPDDWIIALDSRVDGPFKYFPGYMECRDGRLIKGVECPFTRRQGSLSHLPLVFDGEGCAVPDFCTTVVPAEDDVLVPVYEFTRHVANWKGSSLRDSLEGYECDAGTKKRKQMPPGQRIGKRFKSESACVGETRVPLPGGVVDQYYDCETQTVRSCPAGEEFDGSVCRPPLPHPFRYKGLGLFQFDSLSHDNWIVPWKYSQQQPPTVCRDSSFVYDSVYNICSHPDCVHYPFLSQIPSFSIFHPDRSRCFYDPSDRHVKKEEGLDHRIDFWSQSEDDTEPCRMGQRLSTGNFVWDSVVYATCDERQPFVFCPSSSTQSIIQVREGRYACQLPPEMKSSLYDRPTEETTHFEPNEIKKIRPTVKRQRIRIKKNGPWFDLPDEGFEPTAAVDLSATGPVHIDYRYRVTHPPDVVFHEDRYEAPLKGGGFLCKRKDFTQRSLAFPEYTVQSFVSDFHEEKR